MDTRKDNEEIARRVNRGLYFHLCLGPDHFLSDCDKTPAEAKPLVRKRLPLLREEVRAKIPRFTFIIAGLAPPDAKDTPRMVLQKN